MLKLTRRDRFNGLNPIDKTLESMESMQDLIQLYKGYIKKDLDSITTDPTLQAQLKHELGIDW
jgi:hypothetical protein